MAPYNTTPAADEQDHSGPVLLTHRADDILPEAVRWLWPGRLAAGKLHLLEGDPGLGKSVLSLELAARLSRGEALPGASPRPPGAVLIVSYEDGAADTIRPRLGAAGADLQRVHVAHAVQDARGETFLALPDHLLALDAAIVDLGATLVIIDPLMAALAGSVNSYVDHDIRRVLAGLAETAAQTDAAVLVIRHLTKATGQRAILAGGGSIGIVGAARIALGVYADPDGGADDRLLAVVKNNLARHAPCLRFRLDSTPQGVARLVWLGESELTADELVARRGSDETEGETSEVTGWLRDLLTGDVARSRRNVLQAARAEGFSESTVNRAASRLRVERRQQGFGSEKRSLWRLPVIPVKATAMEGLTGLTGMGLVTGMADSNSVNPVIPVNPGTPGEVTGLACAGGNEEAGPGLEPFEPEEPVERGDAWEGPA